MITRLQETNLNITVILFSFCLLLNVYLFPPQTCQEPTLLFSSSAPKGCDLSVCRPRPPSFIADIFKHLHLSRWAAFNQTSPQGERKLFKRFWSIYQDAFMPIYGKHPIQKRLTGISDIQCVHQGHEAFQSSSNHDFRLLTFELPSKRSN